VKSGFCPADLQSFGGLLDGWGKTIWFCTIHYMFCISSCRISLQQARNTTSDQLKMIMKYQKKTTHWYS